MRITDTCPKCGYKSKKKYEKFFLCPKCKDFVKIAYNQNYTKGGVGEK